MILQNYTTEKDPDEILKLLDQAIALGLRSGFGDDRLRIGGVKYFADGSLGARTAWMLEPYADGGVGLPVTPMAEADLALHLEEQGYDWVREKYENGNSNPA